MSGNMVLLISRQDTPLRFIRIIAMGGGNPVLAVQRRSKTNKPQGGKASVNEAGSPHLLEEKCG
ncbi:MAG TPA: hypothetical protein DDZ80_18730 [Cyanobacteria bacterium UBA8803]|nr:hypothetical protein [Cyanobacteria bacterium UBA9273]HBL60413.1 hypothetical protein [Cyanobacteria bacterium UBA8803]